MADKKKKGKKLTLQEFQNEGSPAPTHAVELPSGPRATTVVEHVWPTSPPWNAYIGNLAYEVDEDSIGEFFSAGGAVPIGINIKKGFAYVEFKVLADLKTALTLDGKVLLGREARIDLATVDKKKEGGSVFGSRRGDFGDKPEGRSTGDWRDGPRGYEEGKSSERRSYGGDRGDRKPFEDRGERRPFEDRGDRRPFEDRGDRKPFGDRGDRKPFEDRSDRRPFEDRGDRKPFEDRSERRPFEDRRSGGEGGSRNPFGDRRNNNNDSRGERRPFSSPHGDERQSEGGSDAPPSDATPEASKERKKIVLQKRSVPLEQEESSAPSSPEKPSPFGNAKPVDTATKVNDQKEAQPAPPKSNPFGDAKPVDTFREKEHQAGVSSPRKTINLNKPAAKTDKKPEEKKKEGKAPEKKVNKNAEIVAINHFAGLDIDNGDEDDE